MNPEKEEHSDGRDGESKDTVIEESSDIEINEIDLAMQEVEKYKDLAHRTAAELENLKKRSLQEREEIRKYGQSHLLLR